MQCIPPHSNRPVCLKRAQCRAFGGVVFLCLCYLDFAHVLLPPHLFAEYLYTVGPRSTGRPEFPPKKKNFPVLQDFRYCEAQFSGKAHTKFWKLVRYCEVSGTVRS